MKINSVHLSMSALSPGASLRMTLCLMKTSVSTMKSLQSLAMTCNRLRMHDYVFHDRIDLPAGFASSNLSAPLVTHVMEGSQASKKGVEPYRAIGKFTTNLLNDVEIISDWRVLTLNGDVFNVFDSVFYFAVKYVEFDQYLGMTVQPNVVQCLRTKNTGSSMTVQIGPQRIRIEIVLFTYWRLCVPEYF